MSLTFSINIIRICIFFIEKSSICTYLEVQIRLGQKHSAATCPPMVVPMNNSGQGIAANELLDRLVSHPQGQILATPVEGVLEASFWWKPDIVVCRRLSESLWTFYLE